MKPAVRIIFAPIFRRDKSVRESGEFLHGTAQGRTITLDPRGSQILDTLTHELCHIRHPDWDEIRVREYTKKRMVKDSWKQKARLLKLLGSAIIEGEEE